MSDGKRRYDQIANPTAVLVIAVVMLLLGLYLIIFDPSAFASDSGAGSARVFGIACLAAAGIFGFMSLSTMRKRRR